MGSSSFGTGSWLAIVALAACDAPAHVVGRFAVLSEQAPATAEPATMGPPMVAMDSGLPQSRVTDAAALAPLVDAMADANAPLDAAATRKPCVGDALLCESFEGEVQGQIEEINGGTLSFTEDNVLFGKRALMAVADAEQGARVRLPIVEVSSEQVHLRAYVFIEGGVEVLGFAAIIGFHRSAFTKLSVDLRADNELRLISPGGGWSSEPGALQRDRWQCWELSGLLSTQQQGWARLRVDGQTVVEQQNIITSEAGEPYDSIWVGVEWQRGGSGALRAYIDEVSYARTELPCP